VIQKHWLSAAPSGKESTGLFGVLGWGAYLGTSWTWVIGMVLPALLIRDMGVAGFLVFALPNCIGAAAMGTVLKGKDARELPNRHFGMILTFSIVTVAYHFYIAGYLLPNLLGPLALFLFALSALIGGIFMTLWKDRGCLFFSLIVWVISIICFAVSLILPETNVFQIYVQKPLLDESYMWWFLPASVGGFLLCPYLDATFIRARAKTTRKTGQLAFKIGFLVMFASMIIFTTAYGHKLVDAFAGGDKRLTGVWAIILVIHIPLQMGLTVAWHAREIFESLHFWLKQRFKKLEKSKCEECAVLSRNFWMTAFVAALIGCGLIFLSVFILGVTLKNISFEWFTDFKIAYKIENLYEIYEIKRFISVGEIGYRSILIFYGTLFPAYVMLMMIPTLYPSKQKRSWWVFTATVILSSVTAYLGFVHDQGWAIAATLGFICLGRLWIDYAAYVSNRKEAAGVASE